MDVSKMYVDVENKVEINELPVSDCEVRGAALCADAQYVRGSFGEDTLQHIEGITRELGYPIEYQTLEVEEWYPAILHPISLFAIKQALGWNDEGLRKMGGSVPSYSIVTKLMLRYFASVEVLAEKLQDYWRYNYSKGSLRGMVVGTTGFVCLSDFSLPPILSAYLEGYFVGVLRMIIGKDALITVRKTHKWHKSNNCHDFILRW
jgi:hypothetical protein